MEIIKDKIKVKENIGNVEKEISIEQSYIIPDVKPDIIKNTISNGNIFIEKTDGQSTRIKVDGKLIVFDTYLDGEDNNSGFDTIIPFSEFLEFDKGEFENKEISYMTKAKLVDLEVKIINERKVMLKASAKIEIEMYIENEIELVSDLQDDTDNIQKMEENISISSLIGSGKSRTRLKENVKLTDVEKVINIAKFNYRILSVENKISYNKVLAKSEIELEFLYRNEENKINRKKSQVQLMSFIDIENVSEQNICKINVNVCDVQLSQASDTNIDIEMECECVCDVFEVKKVNIIKDFYGIKNYFQYDKRKISIEKDIGKNQLTKNIDEKVIVEDIDQLYDTKMRLATSNRIFQNGITKFLCTCEVEYLFDTFDNKNIESMSKRFDFEVELQGDVDKISLNIMNSNFLILPDSSIDNKIEISIENIIDRNEEIEVIENVKKDEENKKDSCSLVIYYAQNGDSLWKIAKKFSSTVNDISRINNIENIDEIKIGQKLYIPKVM